MVMIWLVHKRVSASPLWLVDKRVSASPLWLVNKRVSASPLLQRDSHEQEGEKWNSGV
jgi:hypothetical protein